MAQVERLKLEEEKRKSQAILQEQETQYRILADEQGSQVITKFLY
jgi:hypothetical protein